MSELYVFFIILPYLILSKHTHRQTKHVYQETSHQGLYPSIGSLLTFSQMAPMAPCLHACVINQINQIVRNSHRMLLLTDETYPIAESPKPHPTWTVDLNYSPIKTEVKTSKLKPSTEVNLKLPNQVPMQIKWSTAVEVPSTLPLREKNCKTCPGCTVEKRTFSLNAVSMQREFWNYVAPKTKDGICHEKKERALYKAKISFEYEYRRLINVNHICFYLQPGSSSSDI